MGEQSCIAAVVGCLTCLSETLCGQCRTDLGFHPVGHWGPLFKVILDDGHTSTQCAIKGEIYIQNVFKVVYAFLAFLVVFCVVGKFLLKHFYVNVYARAGAAMESAGAAIDQVALAGKQITEQASAKVGLKGLPPIPQLSHAFSIPFERVNLHKLGPIGVGVSHEELIAELKALDDDTLGPISKESMRYAMYHMRWVRVLDWSGSASDYKTGQGSNYALLETDWQSKSAIPREYPLSVDVHTEDICGVGVPLFFNFHMLPFMFALSLLVATATASWYSNIHEVSLDSRSGILDEERAQVLKDTLRDYSERLFVYLGIAYLVNVLVNFFHHACTWHLAHRFNEQNLTMREYTLVVDGLPKDLISERELQEIIERELQVEVVGVSIFIDMQAEIDGERVCDKVWQMYERMVIAHDLCFKNQDVPGLTAQIRFGYDPRLVILEDLEEMDKDGENFRNMCRDENVKAGKFRSTGEAAIVFSKRETLEKVFSETSFSQRLPLCKVKGVQVYAQRTIEPTALEWFNMGSTTSEVAGRAVKGIAGLFFLIFLICVCVYLPMNMQINMPYRALEASPSPFTASCIGVITGLLGSLLFPLLFQVGGFIRFTYKPTFDMLAMTFCLANATLNFIGGNCVALAQHFGIEEKAMVRFLVDQSANETLEGLEFEVGTGDFFFNIMVPGMLFMGWIIGKIMGDLWPPVQHFLTSYLVFIARCLPDKINGLIAAAIPWNPRVMGRDGKTRLPLSARAAEYIWDVKLFDLAWEYPDKIFNCGLCCLSLIALSERAWILFAILFVWVVLMYVYHRYVQLHTYRKYMNTDLRVDAIAVAAWKFPMGGLCAVWAIWGTRLGKFGADPDSPTRLWPMVVFPLVSTLLLLISDYAIFLYGFHYRWKHNRGKSAGETGEQTEYEATARKHLYTWFNTNPCYVLKSHFAPDLLGRPGEQAKPLAPFFYGKEYLCLREENLEHRPSGSIGHSAAATQDSQDLTTANGNGAAKE